MDYFDILLAKKLEDDRDPKVEGLSVTENGRYHEDGVVYDPVIVALPLDKKTITANGTYKASDDDLEGYNEVEVEVPMPANAYLLKDIPNTPTAIATFTDGANLPMPKLEVAIEPVQEGSGDPSPENIRPISGWTEANVNVSGVNIWDEEWANGYYNQGQFISSQEAICCKNKIKVCPNTEMYYVKGFSTASNFYYTFYDINGNFLPLSGYDASGRYSKTESGIISVPNNAYYMTFNMGSGYGTTYNNNISINYPSTDTSYHAYNGQTYTIDLDGTRYGGKVDLVSGVLTVNKLFTKGATVARVGQTGSGVKYADTTNVYTGLVQNALTISDRYIQIDTSQSGEDGKFRAYNGEFTIYNNRFTDATTAQSYLNDVEFCYELATPLTIQLTPTLVKSLQGINNVFADTGDVLDGQYFSKEA